MEDDLKETIIICISVLLGFFMLGVMVEGCDKREKEMKIECLKNHTVIECRFAI